MKSLSQQFDDTLAEVYAEDRRQRKILANFLAEYSNEEELVTYVMEQMNDDAFKIGDDAKTFFCRCADELFIKRLEAARGIKAPESIKRYHPLFGAAWWTT